MSDIHPVGCINGCDRLARSRGLCPSCYNKLSLRVKSGELSWEQAEARGLLLPAKRVYFGGPPLRPGWRMMTSTCTT
jgi:hypothetical protein